MAARLTGVRPRWPTWDAKQFLLGAIDPGQSRSFHFLRRRLMDSLASKYEVDLTQIAARNREAIEKLALDFDEKGNVGGGTATLN